MYYMNGDTCSCDICGFKMKWYGHDDVHGDLWECERCGDMFCTKCFVDLMGRATYAEMMRSGGCILCPECERKLREEEASVRRRMEERR